VTVGKVVSTSYLILFTLLFSFLIFLNLLYSTFNFEYYGIWRLIDILLLTVFAILFYLPIWKASLEDKIAFSEFSTKFFGDLKVIVKVLFVFFIFKVISSSLGIFKTIKLIQTFFGGVQDFLIVAIAFLLLYYFIVWLYKTRWQRTRLSIKLFSILIVVFSAVLIWNQLSETDSGDLGRYSAITYSFASLGAILSFYSFRIKIWVTLANKPSKKKLLLYSLITIIFLSSILGISYIGSPHLHFTSVYFLHLCKFMAVIYLVTFIRILYLGFLSLPTSEILDRKVYEFSSLSYLNRIARSINSLDEILKIVAELSHNASGRNPVWIEWYEEGSTSIKYSLGIDTYILQQHYLSSPAFNYFSTVSTPKIIHSITEIEEYHTGSHNYNFSLKSFLIVPIIFEAQKSGSLVVASRYEYSFDEELLEILVAFVENLKTVMENFRMLKIFSEKERLNHELTIAREIQNKLLPPNVPELERLEISVYTQPAEEVGGDFYDFLDFSNGKFGILIGDVSGKGMSAAFYMALLKGIIMSVPKQITNAKDFLIEVNNSLFNKIDKRIHLTILVLIFDFQKGEVNIARGGHLPLITKNSSSVEQVSPKGIGIPLVDNNRFVDILETTTLPLHSDSYFLLFTDGLIEILGNSDINEGISKLKQIVENEVFINAGELKEKILNYVKIRTKEAKDDMTLITLKIK
jgi:serine phosphatase RsbU (regulator of sigma subunit)